MQVIPVLDLIEGLVVRAKMGDRDAYRPIESPLSATADPVDVTRGLMRLGRFPTLYIADLDAIRGRGDNFAALARLRQAFADVELWIDNGAATSAMVEATQRYGVAVLGSESQSDATLVASRADALLSLDFRGEAFQGPPELLSQPKLWPNRVIVMTLHRIGGATGPDLERLAAIRARAGGRRIYAAGGVRDAADLAALKAVGAAGVLAASALHDGRIGPADWA
ncbi:MAG TPA: HisA/HisF-related TIM barrel protein [Roseiarcus sp.]|nr:HisA/HisF-related TIM barrel protein [Roseiarcus sp.]